MVIMYDRISMNDSELLLIIFQFPALVTKTFSMDIAGNYVCFDKYLVTSIWP